METMEKIRLVGEMIESSGGAISSLGELHRLNIELIRDDGAGDDDQYYAPCTTFCAHVVILAN